MGLACTALIAVEDRLQPNRNSALPLIVNHPDLWQRLRGEFSWSTHTDKARVQEFLRTMKLSAGYRKKLSKRARPYLYYLVEQMRVRQLPIELALLPMIESEYDLYAVSRRGAKGMWQFLDPTGEMFGLHRNWWVDNRYELEASTAAALDYLSYLVKEFHGDWLIALAAYNTGEGAVKRAIAKNRASGKPTDFWALDLRREGRDYAPKLLALIELIKLAGENNKYVLLPIPDRPYLQTVDVGFQLSLDYAAKLSKASRKELVRFNAALLRNVTPPQGPHRLLMPNYLARELTQSLKDNGYRYYRYRVSYGDTLGHIALCFGVNQKLVLQHNQLSRPDRIWVNQELIIPGSVGVGAKCEAITYYGDSNLSIDARETYHTVKRGDTLWEIAAANRVPIYQLLEWNNLARFSPIKIGQRLLIHKVAPGAKK